MEHSEVVVEMQMILTSTEGFPRIYYSESCHQHTALVMELLGPSLESLFNKCNRHFSVKTTTMIALQLVSNTSLVQRVYRYGLYQRKSK